MVAADETILNRKSGGLASRRRLGALCALAVQNPLMFVDRRSLFVERSSNHPTYATDPTGLYEGGSTTSQWNALIGDVAGGTLSASDAAGMPPMPGSLAAFAQANVTSATSLGGSSPVSLTACQVNADNQVINNAIGSGSYSAYGGIPMLTSATAGFGGYAASPSNTNPGGSGGIDQQANLNIAIGSEALAETLQHPADAMAIINESQRTQQLINSTADAQWAQYTQADAAANEKAILQMQYANAPTPPSTHYMELNSPGWGQSGLQWLGTNAPVISSAVNLGVQVGLPAGQRSYSTIALDAGSLGLFGLSAPVDTIGDALTSGVSFISGSLTDATAAAQQYAGAFTQGFSNADVQLTMDSGVGGEFFQRLNSGIRAAAGVNSGELDSGFQNIVSEQFPNGEHQLAASKEYPGINFTADGVPDFAGTPYLYPVTEGQSNIVTINMTGSYSADVDAANAVGGFSETPSGYLWHHLSYEPITGEGTLQLVNREAHFATYPHSGGVAQFTASTGLEYRQ